MDTVRNCPNLSKDRELACRIAAKLYKHPKLITPLLKWLDCYVYIIPAARILHSYHGYIIRANPSDVFLHWLFCDILFVSFTLDEQVMIWKLIKEFSTSPTLQSSHSMSARENSNYIA